MFVKPRRKNGANGHASTRPAEESAIAALGPVNALLYRDFHRTVLPTTLRNFDRCSMAHGIKESYMITPAQLGRGYRGLNLLRNLSALPGCPS